MEAGDTGAEQQEEEVVVVVVEEEEHEHKADPLLSAKAEAVTATLP